MGDPISNLEKATRKSAASLPKTVILFEHAPGIHTGASISWNDLNPDMRTREKKE